MKIQLGRLWAGTEDSLLDLVQRLSQITPEVVAMIEARRADEPTDGQDSGPPLSRLIVKAGTTGIVRIYGSLVEGDDEFWNEWMGVTGYGEIRNAVLQLAMDPEITSIMLDVNSGGGQVTGMSEVADIIAAVNAEIKPVTAFTGGQMCSAAYYTGCAADHITASTMADVGSIGVLIVHRSIARAMTEAGIDVNVIRAGEFKALANPYEQLSDKARKTLQDACDYTYSLFLDHVGEQRMVSKSYARDIMGEGRVFIGQQALDVGLVDSIDSFDAALQAATVAKKVDYLQHGLSLSTFENPKHMKQNPLLAAAREAALRQAQEARAAAEAAAGTGAAPAEGGAPAAGVEGEPAAVAEGEATEGAQAAEGGAVAQEAAPGGVAVAEQLTAAVAQVAVLEKQVEALNDKLLAAGVEAARAKGELEKAQASRTSLRAIANSVVDHLNIALGRAGGTAEKLSDEQLVADHDRLSAEFDANFKAGGVAVPSSTKGAAVSAADPKKAARVQAARLK